MDARIKAVIIGILIYFISQCSMANPASIERYEIVGKSLKGERIALVMGHFGPFHSRSANAKLIVKEANKAEPLLTDELNLNIAHEKELRELYTKLLDKNSKKLQSLGIILNKDGISEADIALGSRDKDHILGWIDLEDGVSNEFAIKSHKLGAYPYPHQDGIVVDILLNGESRLTSIPDPISAWDYEGFSLRNVYKANNTLWFVMDMTAHGYLNAETHWIDIEGVTL